MGCSTVSLEGEGRMESGHCFCFFVQVLGVTTAEFFQDHELFPGAQMGSTGPGRAASPLLLGLQLPFGNSSSLLLAAPYPSAY